MLASASLATVSTSIAKEEATRSSDKSFVKVLYAHDYELVVGRYRVVSTTVACYRAESLVHMTLSSSRLVVVVVVLVLNAGLLTSMFSSS